MLELRKWELSSRKSLFDVKNIGDHNDGVDRDEIGGKNGIEPMALASSKHFDCPLLDGTVTFFTKMTTGVTLRSNISGDLMGRAYPRMNQVIPCVYSDNG